MNDDDDRVLCSTCAHYTGRFRFSIVRLENGAVVRDYISKPTCNLGLGHDPAILRRCERYELSLKSRQP